jgi:hypothetical protein
LAARVCPQCSGKVPLTLALAFSDGVECPQCHTRLTVAWGSRMVSSFTGLFAGALVFDLTSGGPGILDQVLPVLYAFLSFGVVSALTLAFAADLQLAPVAPAVAAAPDASHGHAGGHH